MLLYAVEIIRNCVEKRGGTTGVLNQRAGENGDRERAGYVRPEIHRDTALRHGKPSVRIWGTRRFENAHIDFLPQQLHQLRDVSSRYRNWLEIPRHMRYREYHPISSGENAKAFPCLPSILRNRSSSVLAGQRRQMGKRRSESERK